MKSSLGCRPATRGEESNARSLNRPITQSIHEITQSPNHETVANSLNRQSAMCGAREALDEGDNDILRHGVKRLTLVRQRQRIPFKVPINQIALNPSAVARALGAVAFLLVLASIGGQLTKYWFGHDYVYGLVPLFFVDAEQNIPTLFSVLLLFCAAVLLTVITVLKKKQKNPDVSRWAILAFGFLLMTVDEASAIHETLVTPVRGLLGDGPLGIFYFAWVIPGIAVVLVLTLFLLRFLLRLPAHTRFTFIVAGTLFIGGALGLELVGGRYIEVHGRDNLTSSMIATVEESLEMAGVIVFIYALLTHLADNYGETRFRFDDFEGH